MPCEKQPPSFRLIWTGLVLFQFIWFFTWLHPIIILWWNETNPEKSPKWCQTLPQGIFYPSLYGGRCKNHVFWICNSPYFVSHNTKKKYNNKNNHQRNLRSCVGLYFGCRWWQKNCGPFRHRQSSLASQWYMKHLTEPCMDT